MIIEGRNACLKGEIVVPGDKSISHRSIMIGSIAEGITEIDNFLFSEDTWATIDCFKNMGVNITSKNGMIEVKGVGLNGLKPSQKPLYCGNSGTTMRLISGILIGQDFSSTLLGDDSLNKRPMKRIIEPLRKMGGLIEGIKDEYPPLQIHPTQILSGIHYQMPISSAQVKSAILFASLYSKGETAIVEKAFSRDHTERMLEYFGANINKKDSIIFINDVQRLEGKRVFVPNDFSSAAYFIIAALTLKNSQIKLKDVGLNDGRIGLLKVLKKMGGYIEVENLKSFNNELVGDINVRYSKLKAVEVGGDIISSLIDEIPALAVAASLADGTTVIRNAEELKYKETNRLKAIRTELRKMGVGIDELDDGLIIEGRESLKPAILDSHMDHRIAMALSIAALNGKGKSQINNADCVNISFPGFYQTLYNSLIFS
ncbi:3-phosphoshikimate 1-carboxyvinyltransferase [Anaerosalibacter sp. Marseille-P3206]|uniref:3-phosphoshikimate 1-carboxyvinyltransferase n=1 Tax=Anaerosalibacter sp. Marseille-P3206 TaxID=1871005 RepID=UPI0009842F6C|nr:3-phosphoshikimate 1-carboxyvinyltransferase [Anaerosalibacter sp. Marseille-P3206]